ncbi:ethanolamine ammonia-lyase subunit EutB [Deinococcus aquaticus]|uniref:ethanolamine ammonia-lyase subunit EutB n=1 Tax=Deinococcus aquaticus TaxID=328692 RepID=UPI003617F787
MYFETGQGSALSAGAHGGVDQGTAEARAYAVARAFRPLLVNTVVGFIGPEYLYDGKQIIRAGLEDHFCAKLLGLPMGCDICYTNHAEADGDDMDTLMTMLGAAGVTFIMGVPGADDIMLNYQSTSFHDAWYLRRIFGRPPPRSSPRGWNAQASRTPDSCGNPTPTAPAPCSAAWSARDRPSRTHQQARGRLSRRNGPLGRPEGLHGRPRRPGPQRHVASHPRPAGLHAGPRRRAGRRA